MTTSRKKTVTAASLPVPAPFEKALKTAAEKVEGIAQETKDMAAKVEQGFRSAATNMKKKGQNLAKNPKGFVETVVRDGKTISASVKENVEKVRDEMSREATRVAEEVSKRVSAAVEKVVDNSLHRLNVPTRDELRMLTHKVDLLAKKIDILTGVPKAAVKPAPRPAAKPAPRVAAKAPAKAVKAPARKPRKPAAKPEAAVVAPAAETKE